MFTRRLRRCLKGTLPVVGRFAHISIQLRIGPSPTAEASNVVDDARDRLNDTAPTGNPDRPG
jgi:hypothetical protein